MEHHTWTQTPLTLTLPLPRRYPGFNCVCCCIGEAVSGGLSLRIQQLDVRCETKTKDNVSVLLHICPCI
jgi:hypothetical protein